VSKNRRPGNKFPADQGRGGNQTLQVQQRSELRVGPLPDPSDLERYDLIVRGAAERIIRMAETQAAHSQSQERLLLEANIRAHDAAVRIQRRGQIFALVMGLAALSATVATAWMGHENVAIALAVSCVGALVAAFLGGRLTAGKGEKPPSK
jgi:uncharacterized membrane protein